MKYNAFFCILSLAFFSVSQLKAQWLPSLATSTDDINRTGVTGIGFASPAAAATAANGETRFLVNGTGSDGGILAHYVSGSVGNFAGKWCGLGIGNPGGSVQPYGLAIADTGSVGFYNIIREVFEGATRKNTVAGFGAEGSNINRFIVRAYSGTNAATGKDLLVANPEGGIGVNAEPQSSLWVDATGTNLDSLFRAIVIRGSQPLPSISSTRTVTAIGTQANTSLAGNGIAVEGLRAQIPDFATVAQTLAGVATNLQTVKNPTATSALDVISPVLTDTDEYAELTWQDLDFGDTAVVDCEVFPIADAEELDKFFISFRNNENTDPFAAGNKLPVMTFQANGRVGIGTLQPTSGSCGPEKQTILLDVNGLIRASGSLVTSDRRFKQDIETIPNSLELIRKMRGATYTFNQAAFPDRNFSGGKQYGFIAQESGRGNPGTRCAQLRRLLCAKLHDAYPGTHRGDQRTRRRNRRPAN